MEKQQCDPLQKFDKNNKTEILKKRLLKPASTSSYNILTKNSSQQNVLLSNLRAPTSSSMIVSSMQASQSSMPITHNLVTHSIAPVKIHTGNSSYPLQLSTVHVPVQIPGSSSNINVPVQLSGTSNSLQIAPVSLPLQVSGTTTVPVQLPAGETINVPLQIPASQNIQLTGPGLPSMPLLQSTSQSLHNSIIHVHMGSNSRTTNMEASSELSVTTSQSQLTESGVQVKMNSTTSVSVSQVQVSSNQTVVQIPNSSSNPIQLTLPNAGGTGTVQLRGAGRPVPHVVYIQTPTGLKPVTSTEVISQAGTSGNPPQIIVRRPVPNSSNFHVISNVNKPNIAPKIIGQNKSSLLTPANSGQPIVIQKPKSNEKMMVPISIAPGTQGKQAVAYLGPVKKGKSLSENQSILISNNQGSVTSNNQKLFITPLNMPKIQNTKLILPVTLPATMASKGPIINLQIANGQIQNDPQGNITVMRDTADKKEMPPLQPLAMSLNGKETNSIPQSPKNEKPFSITLMGSRAEPTGEQGEYTLSIPETNASMNDDIFTVSIADGEGGQVQEKSFTLSIPEKGKSLLNKNVIERNDSAPGTIAAPAILRRSNSDNSDKKNTNTLLKRRISLCTELNKASKLNISPPKVADKQNATADINDDHRVPSLFCDEKMEKDLDVKVNHGDSDGDDYKEKQECYSKKSEVPVKKGHGVKREFIIHEEDPPGLVWNNGVGMLRGSSLHFQTNEFGLIDLAEGVDLDDSSIFQTPLKLRANAESNEKKSASPDDLYRCDGCGCHGMAAEFITPNYCSVACQSDVQKILQKKREIERAALIRKKNKIKKLLMRKQLSESDIPSDLRDDKELLKYLDEGDAALPEAAIMKHSGEDLIENEKYPWMCGKNGFSWMRYLDVCKAKAAPVKLFKDPFPYNRNGFKVGMRMEAIDPQNPAVFCVVSVAEVQGYRMRLHFDEYPDVYDYWVNADCPDIFPAGWCEKNNRPLKPPSTHTPANFSWPLYLKQKRAVAAAKQLFSHVTGTSVKSNGFRIGMKLEAEDRKNDLVCVATIADMLDNRMRINFDSWDEQYDYWVDPTSPYIHAVGWAEENGVPLTPPNFFKEAESFTWEGYLAHTGASAAPPRAFKTRPPHGFKPGMKLEVVDIRVPFLIRVASVSAVKGHQVQISYDGWPDHLAVWMDDDSPDIHPVGWCLKTGHPLEPPLTAEEGAVEGACGVAGCRGLGSRRGGAHKQHGAAAACPYRAAPAPPPRLPAALPAAAPPPPRISNTKSKPISSGTPTNDTTKPLRGRPPKHKRVEVVTKIEGSDDESVSSGGGGGKRFRSETQQSEQERTAEPEREQDRKREQDREREQDRGREHDREREHGRERERTEKGPLQMFAKYLSTLPSNPQEWTQEEVAFVVSAVAGSAAGLLAARARLCGGSLLLASCAELAAALRLRLGPAVKLHALVRALRAAAPPPSPPSPR